jgi:hypothetical protein
MSQVLEDDWIRKSKPPPPSMTASIDNGESYGQELEEEEALVPCNGCSLYIKVIRTCQ